MKTSGRQTAAVHDRIESCTRIAQVSAAGQGDRNAAASLIDELLPRMRRTVQKLVRDDSDGDDLAQEAVLAVLRSLPGYRGEGFFEGWVDRVVERSIFGARRRRRARQKLWAAGATVTWVHRGDFVVQDEYLARWNATRILQVLPAKQKDVVIYRYGLEMTVPEIAEALQISFETVRSRLRLARRRLRTIGDPVPSPQKVGETAGERGPAL